MNIMKLKDWKEVMDLDFPGGNITHKTRQTMIEADKKYLINDTRLATGRFYINVEYELRRERILSSPLP